MSSHDLVDWVGYGGRLVSGSEASPGSALRTGGNVPVISVEDLPKSERHRFLHSSETQIGRASCRERV